MSEPKKPKTPPVKEPERKENPKGDPQPPEKKERLLSEFDEAEHYYDERADIGGKDLDVWGKMPRIKGTL